MSITLLDFLILSAATLYLSYALTKTHGPFHLFEKTRERFPLGGLTTCIVCSAPWIAAVCYGLLLTPLKIVVYAAAVAGLAMFAAFYNGMAQQ